MKKKYLASCLASILLIPSMAMAAGPGSDSETKYDVRIGQCYADSLTVKWKLDSLMGEPTVSGSFKWSGDACRLPSSTTIWLKVKENSGSGYGYVYLSPATPKADSGYGYNTTGSPNWNSTICGYDGTRKSGCFNSSDAKHIWKNGYVSDFVVTW